MDVRLTGWSSQNIRGGLRALDINLSPGPPRWTLVQMPNGTGKTTTMDLLRWTLTGEGEKQPPAVIRALRSNDEVESGLFEARLVVNGQAVRLQLELNYRDGSATCWTVRAGERSGGREEGRALPPELRALLKPNLTDLFVFNGELANDILDLGKSKAADAIRSLYGLDALDGLRRSIDLLVEQEQKRASSVTAAKERKGINQLQNSLNDVQAAKARLETQLNQAEGRRSKLMADLAALDKEINDRLSEDTDVRNQLATIGQRQAEVEANAAEYSAQVLDILRRPAHIHPRILERLQHLGGKLYELKLPETMSREFFRELASQTVCVCGRPIGHAERHAIESGADRYLAQDQISIINQMKLALRQSQAEPGEFAARIEALKQQLELRRNLKGERERLASERIAEGDDQLAGLRAQKQTVVEEIDRLVQVIDRLTTKDPARQKSLRLTWETNLALCEAELKTRRIRLETATRTRTFSRQGEALKTFVDQTAVGALDLLRERVRQRTNDKLRQILKTESIHIAKIGGGLELASDRLGAKQGASEGQKLAIAYAFLTSLLSGAPYNLPFIVDSPAVSLDTAVRREVGELIPTFFDQMIMFVISSEREGFADAFYERLSEVEFLTVQPAGDGSVNIARGVEAFREFHGREVGT